MEMCSGEDRRHKTPVQPSDNQQVRESMVMVKVIWKDIAPIIRS